MAVPLNPFLGNPYLPYPTPPVQVNPTFPDVSARMSNGTGTGFRGRDPRTTSTGSRDTAVPHVPAIPTSAGYSYSASQNSTNTQLMHNGNGIYFRGGDSRQLSVGPPVPTILTSSNYRNSSALNNDNRIGFRGGDASTSFTASRQLAVQQVCPLTEVRYGSQKVEGKRRTPSQPGRSGRTGHSKKSRKRQGDSNSSRSESKDGKRKKQDRKKQKRKKRSSGSRTPPHTGPLTPLGEAPSARTRATAKGSGVTQKSLKEFPCPIKGCAKAFGRKQHLRDHINSGLPRHENKRPYQCSYIDCGKKFAQKTHLNRHAKIHSGVKKHVCEVCVRGFVQKGNLKSHVKTQHVKTQFMCISPENINVSLRCDWVSNESFV